MPSVGDQLKIFTGNANPELAREICEHLKKPLGLAQVSRFPDGEIWVKIGENVRGADVFVVQPTFAPADNLMELLIMCDALLRASAHRITAVIPYFGYARQERKSEPRVPISAKLVANLISAAGVNRVLTMDMHSEVISGFFDLPVDHLFAAPVIIGHFRKKRLDRKSVV
jgi:ribose-phosphate pyrophosphokinase